MPDRSTHPLRRVDGPAQFCCCRGRVHQHLCRSRKQQGSGQKISVFILNLRKKPQKPNNRTLIEQGFALWSAATTRTCSDVFRRQEAEGSFSPSWSHQEANVQRATAALQQLPDESVGALQKPSSSEMGLEQLLRLPGPNTTAGAASALLLATLTDLRARSGASDTSLHQPGGVRRNHAAPTRARVQLFTERCQSAAEPSCSSELLSSRQSLRCSSRWRRNAAVAATRPGRLRNDSMLEAFQAESNQTARKQNGGCTLFGGHCRFPPESR